MTDTNQNTELADLIERLPRGGKRQLAIQLGINPGKINDARDGLVKNQEFLDKLRDAVLRKLALPAISN